MKLSRRGPCNTRFGPHFTLEDRWFDPAVTRVIALSVPVARSVFRRDVNHVLDTLNVYLFQTRHFVDAANAVARSRVG